jgi:Cys-rich repeat protein
MAVEHTRSLSLSLVCLAFALVACDELDPVFTRDLCNAPPGQPISIHCKQCQGPVLAAGCPQCRVDPPSEGCESAGDMSPATNPPDGTMSGTGAEPGTPSATAGNGSPEAGGGAKPAAPSGGHGQPPGMGGTNGGGMSSPNNPSGAGGEAPSAGASGSMTEPLDCGCPSTQHCRFDRACVECLQDTHCPGRRCNPATYLCVNCLSPTDCTAPQSVCDSTDHTCVQCMKPSDCSGMLGTCDLGTRECVDCNGDNSGCTDNRLPACFQQHCVECTNDTECTHGPNKHCDLDTHTCVQCNQREGDCGDASAPLCLEAEHSCVQCLAKEDCRDPDYSKCTATHECAGCDSSADCSRFRDTPVCDPDAHRCVGCNSPSDCPGTACIKSSQTCGDAPVKSVDACMACKANDECKAQHVCVNMLFGSPAKDVGNYCLPVRDLNFNFMCIRPLNRAMTATKTVDGDVQTVCAPAATTTCPAYRNNLSRKVCSVDADCAVASTDGFCDLEHHRCSFRCASDLDCPTQLSCNLNAGFCSEKTTSTGN